jgi:cysteine synthase
LAAQFEAKALPALAMWHEILLEVRPKVQMILSNVADMTTIARENVQSLDASVASAMDQARLQAIRVDELFSRTLDRVEEVTELVSLAVVSPVRRASGILQGLMTGVATLLNRGPYARVRSGPGVPRENMFI